MTDLIRLFGYVAEAAGVVAVSAVAISGALTAMRVTTMTAAFLHQLHTQRTRMETIDRLPIGMFADTRDPGWLIWGVLTDATATRTQRGARPEGPRDPGDATPGGDMV